MTDKADNDWNTPETWQAAKWLGEAGYMDTIQDRIANGEINLILEGDDLCDFVERTMANKTVGLTDDSIAEWSRRVNWRGIAVTLNAYLRTIL